MKKWSKNKKTQIENHKKNTIFEIYENLQRKFYKFW